MILHDHNLASGQKMDARAKQRASVMHRSGTVRHVTLGKTSYTYESSLAYNAHLKTFIPRVVER